ncbi:hypothetical protein JTE90_027193, partial [Oedothorax gibbosus]
MELLNRSEMAGLDLLARKSLERGSDASILVTNSVLASNQKQDHWSWRHLREQFCMKSAEPLFEKYQARLQHSMFILALTANIVSGALAILLLCCLSPNPFDSIRVSIALKTLVTVTCLILYIISYQEKWFFSTYSRIFASCFLLVLTASSELATSLLSFSTFADVGQRFSVFTVLVCSVFLPFPKWYQVTLATFAVTVLELFLSGWSLKCGGGWSWPQMCADVIFHVTVSLMGLYIRFLMEFTNRKAFLDRRECFESKFHLQYEKDQEERLLLSVLPKHISVQVKESIRDVIRRIHLNPMPQRPFTELFVEKHRNVSILYADIVNSVALTASLHGHELVETLNELFGRFDDKAEMNSCLRIKLLGDCYYCVSGMPEYDSYHADHCVQMALDMIEII